ncbi:Nn.00g082070.m01.CDS01 [Neocucurbitaria sp. VM-36]
MEMYRRLIMDPRHTFVPPELTPEQEQRKRGQARGRELWEQALSEYHDPEPGSDAEIYFEARADSESDTSMTTSEVYDKFEHFLDLPPELRNMVYARYLEAAKDKAKGNDARSRREKLQDPIHSSFSRGLCSTSDQSMLHDGYRPRSYGNRKRWFRHRLQKAVWKTLERAEQQDGVSDEDGGESFDEYEAQQLHATKCVSSTDDRKSNDVRINARGSLDEDMPFLSLTSRQLLREIWGLYFLGRPRYTMAVANFDYFPHFRFLQMIQRLEIDTKIPGELVDITLFATDKHDDNRCDEKFTRLKRLIELHWLDGLPLWGCLTGLRNVGETEYSVKHVYWGWMYSVRQIVALYRIKPATWRSISIKYLQRYKFLRDDDFDASIIAEYSNPELVQAVIEMLSTSLECELGCTGNFRSLYRDSHNFIDYDHKDKDLFRLPGYAKRVAYELDHASVLVARQYREKAGTLLKSELGSLYEEWEASEDKKSIPQDVLL